jgi:hypothetical protein
MLVTGSTSLGYPWDRTKSPWVGEMKLIPKHVEHIHHYGFKSEYEQWRWMILQPFRFEL